MADGPSIDSSFAYRQSQNASGKPGFIGPFPMEWNAGGGLGLAAAAPLGKTIPGVFKGPGKEGGMGDKFLKAMMAAADEIKQMSAQAHIMYAGDLPSGSAVSSGSSFASGISMGGGDGPMMG